MRAESSHRPPRHRRDACSIAWRCRFLTARSSQDGRVHPTLVDFHTEQHMGKGHSELRALTVTSACGMPNLGPPWSGWTTTTSPTPTCAGTGSPRLTSTTVPSTAIVRGPRRMRLRSYRPASGSAVGCELPWRDGRRRAREAGSASRSFGRQCKQQPRGLPGPAASKLGLQAVPGASGGARRGCGGRRRDFNDSPSSIKVGLWLYPDRARG